MNILNHITAASSTFKYQVGANGGQTIAVDFGNMTDTVSGVFTELKASHNVITFTTTASAITQGTSAVVALDAAITAVNSQRATFGAAMNQLTYAVDNLSNVQVNAEASAEPHYGRGLCGRDFRTSTHSNYFTSRHRDAGTSEPVAANRAVVVAVI